MKFLGRSTRRLGSAKKLRRQRKSTRKNSRSLGSNLSLERLETRIALSVDPVLTVAADQIVDEGSLLSLTDLGTYTDVVEGSGASSIGLDANDFSAFSLGAFDPLADVVIDTDALTVSGLVGTGTTQLADTGSGSYEIAVFTFDSFELDSNVTITATGSRPLALLSLSDISVSGTIDVSAPGIVDQFGLRRGQAPGPGGGAGGETPLPFDGEGAAGSPLVTPTQGFGRNLGNLDNGGGGGAFGGDGGRGFDGSLRPNQGIAYGDLSLGIQGGSGGAAGNGGIFGQPHGGGGGGGVELGAVGSVTITGQVLALGADSDLTTGASGGGGAGGGILVHGVNVIVSGTLDAEGGGGAQALGSGGFGGSGGGGRILLAHDTSGLFDQTGATISVAGGRFLGGNGEVGQDGDFSVVAVMSSAVVETYDFSINWGDGSAIDTGAADVDAPGSVGGPDTMGSFDGSHTYTDNGVFEVMVTLNDSGGGTDTQSFMVNVSNVAPLAALGNDGPVDEGSSATVSFSGQIDPSSDDTSAGFRYAYDFDNDGTFEVGDGTFAGSVIDANQVVPASFLSDGPATVTVSGRILDDDGGFTDVTTDITVLNVAPSIAADAASVTVDEGQTAANSGTFSDPGDDTVTLSASIGSVLDLGGGLWSWSFNTADGPDDSQSVMITATDSDGDSNDVSFSLVVDNVDPTADAGGPYTTFDDLPITLNGSGFDVAGAADPLLFEWDFDGDFNTVEAVGESVTFDPAALGITMAAVVNVSLRVSDGDGGIALDSADVTVLTDGALLIDGTLHVVGSNTEDDQVFVRESSGVLEVFASFNNDNPFTFDLADVNDIQIRTRGGDDRVVVSHSVDFGVTIDGGSDNDALRGGSGDDLIFGGTGNDMLAGQDGNDKLLAGEGTDDLFGGRGDDVLVAGADNDMLFGGSGRDLMIGGLDGDFLIGGSGDDILIGGITIHDNDIAALDAAMAIWTSSDSFNTRVAQLTGAGGLLESGVAVFDDDDSDVLIGGGGRDLLFADTTFAGGDIDFVFFNHRFDHLETTN